jgi:hypothetical protein
VKILKQKNKNFKAMKKIVLLNIFLMVSCLLFAQTQNDTTKVARDVTIEREYNPVIMDAKKVNQNLVISEPEFEKKEVVYSQYNTPLHLKSPSVTIPQAPLTVMNRTNYKKGYAKLAIAVPLNWEIDFAYPLINTSDCKLNFRIDHEGQWWNGKKKNFRIENNAQTWLHQQYFDTKANLNFQKNFSASELYSNLSYHNRAFNYYGTTEIFGDKSFIKASKTTTADSLVKRYERFNNIDFNIGYKALPSANFYYDVQAAYHLFSIPSQFSEHQIDVKTEFNIPIAKNSLSFKLGAENLLYSKSKEYNDSLQEVSSVIEFSPKFNIKRELYHLHIGLKSFFAINRGQLVNIAPDVELEYYINPKVVSFYLGVTGNYELNSLRALYAENWYLNINQNKMDTYTPLDAYFGFKIKPKSHLFIDAFVRYKILLGQHFFVNQTYEQIGTSDILYANTFGIIDANWQALNAGIHLKYNYKDHFDVFFKGQYNGWYKMKNTTESFAWNQPTFEISVGGNVNITKDVRLSANYYLASNRKVALPNKVVRLRDIHDFNLSASYTYNNWLTAFLKVDNLLGMIPSVRYQNWYGYDVLGSVMAGVIFSF